MASVTTNTFYTYKDIALDLEPTSIPNARALHGSNEGANDIKADIDEACIQTSITNIFSTIPGEKLLNPGFGVPLLQWLFDELSEERGQELGDAVANGIDRFEPRVQVDKVHVQVDYDQSQYIILLYLTIPLLNNLRRQYTGMIDSTGLQLT